jgi:hypothetical protein
MSTKRAFGIHTFKEDSQVFATTRVHAQHLGRERHGITQPTCSMGIRISPEATAAFWESGTTSTDMRLSSGIYTLTKQSPTER